MVRSIVIQVRGASLEAVLNETRTADAVWGALPLEARANTWGEEIYFDIPVNAELEDGQEVVAMGDLGYWPPGNALCLFFGRTPVSRGDEVRPASAVTVFGRISGDLSALKTVRPGDVVKIARQTTVRE